LPSLDKKDLTLKIPGENRVSSVFSMDNNNTGPAHPQKNNLSSATPVKSGTKMLIAVSWLICIVLGAWQAWNFRFYMDADGISYLDIGDTYFRGDWNHAINAYWSPLYSWLLGSAIHFLKPSSFNEFTVVHLVNFIIYLFALGCFHFFILQLIRHNEYRRDKFSGISIITFPEWAWIMLGYSLFLYSSLNMISLSTVTPDMFVSAIVYLACGIILRMYAGVKNYFVFALLGTVLGFGYLTKSAMFPLAFIFLSLSFFTVGNFRKALRYTLVALIFFLCIAGPFISTISYAKGRFTFGEAGKFNYYHVSKFKIGRYWDDARYGNEPFKHPPRKVFDLPRVYEFGTPIAGTYPIWYDPSFWYDGLKIRFNFGNQLRVFQSTISGYYQIFFPDFGILFFIIPVLFFMSRRKRLVIRDIAEQWILLIPAIAALGMYFMVSAEPRYIAPFISLLWIGILSGIHLPGSDESKRLLRIATILITSVIMIISTHHVIKNRLPSPTHSQWQIADAIRQMGVLPGDKVASIGYSHSHFWARLAKVNIVAEIPGEDVDYFWRANRETQLKVIETFGRTGAKVIVTNLLPDDISHAGWQQLGSSNYYVYVMKHDK
jgi:hypothetical protein